MQKPIETSSSTGGRQKLMGQPQVEGQPPLLAQTNDLPTYAQGRQLFVTAP